MGTILLTVLVLIVLSQLLKKYRVVTEASFAPYCNLYIIVCSVE